MDTIKVRRANVILHIDPAQKSEYLSKGFDIIGEDGKVVEESFMTNDVGTLHKKLTEALERIKALEKENKKLKHKLNSDDEEPAEEIPDEEPVSEKKSKRRSKE